MRLAFPLNLCRVEEPTLSQERQELKVISSASLKKNQVDCDIRLLDLVDNGPMGGCCCSDGDVRVN